MINNYLSQLNETNSSKVKLETLKKIQKEDDGTFKKILAYTYDKVTYTFGVTPRTVENFSESANSYTDMFTLLDDLNARKLTGNKALAECKGFIETSENANLFLKIIDRDLKCGINAKTISKVFKDIIRN